MKKLSIPQMVILLDVLFIFLFILIIKESPPKTKIILPSSQLEVGGFLSHEYEKGKYIWYDPSFQEWSGAENDNLINLHDGVGKYTLLLDCEQECINTLKSRYNLHEYESNIKIAITNKLYDEIARVTYMACQTDADSCGNIVFTINDQWKIDKKALLNDNKFLKKIPGMEKNF